MACALAASSGRAAVPAPEKLLADDTLVMLTVPDWARFSGLCRETMQYRFWSEPAMKPFTDKFSARWQEEFVKPLERELNVSLAAYSSLPQGQLTLAVTQNGWQGKSDRALGFLLLLDAKDQSGVLKKNLAELRQRWVDAGKTLKTAKEQDIEFAIFPISSNNVPATLRKFFPRPNEFQAPPGEVGARKGPGPGDAVAGSLDLVLDAITSLLVAGNELVIGQADSLLIVANSMKVAENVATRFTGGALPALADLPAYQSSHSAQFRDAPFYGWINVKAFADVFCRKPGDKPEPETPDPFDVIPPEKLFNFTGLAAVKTLALSLQVSNEGPRFQLTVASPEATRQGLFKLIAGEAKETAPPPFVPVDAVKFQRWRLDGQKTWTLLEKMLTDASSQAVSTLNWILETAGARAKQKDPAFDLKQMLVTNLGDDLVSYEKAPRGDTLAELRSPPSIVLLSSPHPDRLTAALKNLFVIFPQGDTLSEREFLGRKIASVPMPPTSIFSLTPPNPDPPATLHFAATGGYVALSTDAVLLEEYLRSSESQAKPLRERPGIAEAVEKAGGVGVCMLGYENQVESMRSAFEAMKKDPTSAANANHLGLFPGLPGLGGVDKHFRGSMDFSLLPPFEKVAPYFSFATYTEAVNVEGLTFKFFAPIPPALRGNAVAKTAK